MGNSSGKTVLTQLCPRMMRNFNKLVCYYIWKLYYIRTSGIIWTFWISNFYSDYHLNYIITFITVASGWLCFVMCYYVYHYVCIVSLCVFACISTCTLGITEDIFKMMYPRLIKSLSIM